MHVPKRMTTALAAASIASMALSGSVSAASTPIYDRMPSPQPGNVPSIALEANQASQFGDRIAFSAGSSRVVTSVTVLMSSWGCETGHWYSFDCVTTPGATFTHPVTLNLFNVGPGAQVGTLIASVTQTFSIPLRPSRSPACGDGRWQQPSTGLCFNGYATPITFDLANVVVPDQVIVGIAYNTSHYGAVPQGTATACYGSSAGCGYDSLNVGTFAAPPTVGTDPAPTDAYFDTETAANYCDDGLAGTGTSRLDQGCWAGLKPAITVRAALPTPASKDACKNGGWASLYRADGTPFKNQGDCIQYVNTGK